jgi:RNA polymerase sigma factor (TIGR02999 family)
MPPPPADVTRLLQDWSRGEAAALEELMPLVFEDLRKMARWHFQRESADHTLQPTALVNEVYLRLADQRKVQWDDRRQFFSFAALLMRRILVDYAKGRQTAKRGSGMQILPLEEALGVAEAGKVDLIALDAALSSLAAFDERLSRIVTLRFFIGLTLEEIADVVGLSLSTVKREWQTAKLWLHRELASR